MWKQCHQNFIRLNIGRREVLIIPSDVEEIGVDRWKSAGSVSIVTFGN